MNETVKYAIVGAGNISSATVNGKDAIILVGVKQINQQTDISAFIEPYVIRKLTIDIPTMIKPPKLSHKRNYKYHK